jgi:ATP-binding protein involved in chromosome partitioning
LLGEIPIDVATREAGDTGMPVVARAQESAVGREFVKIASALRAELEGASAGLSSA